MSTSSKIERALISVSDKRGITEFATALAERGVAILSTGGTARALREAGLTVTEVSEHTGAPEIMDGRVKTLHPVIHGGILGRRDIDAATMVEHDIAPIDLIVVNLYPFRETIARADCTPAQAIENIDIGGPTLLRAAAKNHRFVTVVTDPADHAAILADMDAHDGAVTHATRRRLAALAFAHTAAYDDAVADYMATLDADDEQQPFGPTLNRQWRLSQNLRYGENPHQQAAFYVDPEAIEGTLATARKLQGKALSYNNLADTDAALACVRAFDQHRPVCAIIKHANPCGVAVADTLEAAYQRAFATDPTSSFGGILAFNQELDGATAAAILANQFAEVVIAPEVSKEAHAVLAHKKNLRVLAVGMTDPAAQALAIKQIGGGVLVQHQDQALLDDDALRTVTRRTPTEQETADLMFAWRVAKHVHSNAIVYARNGATIGVGAGQMSRVDSARIAGLKAADAGLDVHGAVMASDAFFPFRDGIDAAAQAGVRAVIQPGGSIRDEEVIAAADEADIAMLFTGMRHFRH